MVLDFFLSLNQITMDMVVPLNNDVTVYRLDVDTSTRPYIHGQCKITNITGTQTSVPTKMRCITCFMIVEHNSFN